MFISGYANTENVFFCLSKGKVLYRRAGYGSMELCALQVDSDFKKTNFHANGSKKNFLKNFVCCNSVID